MFLLENHLYFRVLCYFAHLNPKSFHTVTSNQSSFKPIIFPKGITRLINFKFFLATLLFGVLVLQKVYLRIACKYNHIKTCATFFDQVVTIVILGGFVVALIFYTVIMKSMGTLTLYISGHIFLSKSIESSGKKRKLSVLEFLNLLYAYNVLLFCLIYPFVTVYGLHWRNPCKASLAGYWLLRECTSDSSIENLAPPEHIHIITKQAILFVNYLVTAMIAYASPFVISAVSVFCTLSFCVYIQEFEKISTHRSKWKSPIVYRKIQYLSNLMNELQRWRVTGSLVVGIVSCFAVSAASVVRLTWSAENIIAIMLFISSLSTAIAATVCVVGGQANVYKKSNSVLKLLRKRTVLHCSDKKSKLGKWKHRFYWSCPPIKVGFGSLNFVDQFTPLNILDFGVHLTVQIILVV